MFASFPNVTCLNSFRVRWSAIPYRTNRTMTFALYTIKIREKKERRNEREFLPSSRFIKFLKIIKESNRFRGKKTETRNEDSNFFFFFFLFFFFFDTRCPACVIAELQRQTLILYYIFTSDYIGQPLAIAPGRPYFPHDDQRRSAPPPPPYPPRRNEVPKRTKILFLFVAKLTRVPATSSGRSPLPPFPN